MNVFYFIMQRSSTLSLGDLMPCQGYLENNQKFSSQNRDFKLPFLYLYLCNRNYNWLLAAAYGIHYRFMHFFYVSLTTSHLPCAACPSASPGPSGWNVCRPLSSGTFLAPACSAPYLAPPHPSIAAGPRKKGEKSREDSAKKEEN